MRKYLLNPLRVLLSVLMGVVALPLVAVLAIWLALAIAVWPFSTREMRQRLALRRASRGVPPILNPSRN